MSFAAEKEEFFDLTENTEEEYEEQVYTALNPKYPTFWQGEKELANKKDIILQGSSTQVIGSLLWAAGVPPQFFTQLNRADESSPLLAFSQHGSGPVALYASKIMMDPKVPASLKEKIQHLAQTIAKPDTSSIAAELTELLEGLFAESPPIQDLSARITAVMQDRLNLKTNLQQLAASIPPVPYFKTLQAKLQDFVSEGESLANLPVSRLKAKLRKIVAQLPPSSYLKLKEELQALIANRDLSTIELQLQVQYLFVAITQLARLDLKQKLQKLAAKAPNPIQESACSRAVRIALKGIWSTASVMQAVGYGASGIVASYTIGQGAYWKIILMSIPAVFAFLASYLEADDAFYNLPKLAYQTLFPKQVADWLHRLGLPDDWRGEIFKILGCLIVLSLVFYCLSLPAAIVFSEAMRQALFQMLANFGIEVTTNPLTGSVDHFIYEIFILTTRTIFVTKQFFDLPNVLKEAQANLKDLWHDPDQCLVKKFLHALAITVVPLATGVIYAGLSHKTIKAGSELTYIESLYPDLPAEVLALVGSVANGVLTAELSFAGIKSLIDLLWSKVGGPAFGFTLASGISAFVTGVSSVGISALSWKNNLFPSSFNFLYASVANAPFLMKISKASEQQVLLEAAGRLAQIIIALETIDQKTAAIDFLTQHRVKVIAGEIEDAEGLNCKALANEWREKLKLLQLQTLEFEAKIAADINKILPTLKRVLTAVQAEYTTQYKRSGIGNILEFTLTLPFQRVWQTEAQGSPSDLSPGAARL